MKNRLSYIILIALFAGFSGCADDYMDTVPTSSVNADVLFADPGNLSDIINGIALIMDSHVGSTEVYQQGLGGESGIKIWYGNFVGNAFTSPAETNYGAGKSRANGDYHTDPTNANTSFPWYYYYRVIASANNVLPYINIEEGQVNEMKRLKAATLTFRAYAYSMLIQLYGWRWEDSDNGTNPNAGGVVLRLSPDDPDNMPLSTIAKTYAQIYKDLDEAIGLFKESGWVRPASDFWTPNINVAYATYARAAINRCDYETAKTMAQKAREGYGLMSVPEYKSGFNSPNSEWIWGSYADVSRNQLYYGFHSNMAYDGQASTRTTATKVMVKRYYQKIPATDIRKKMFLGPDVTGTMLPESTTTTYTVPDSDPARDTTIVTYTFNGTTGAVIPAQSVGKRPNVTIIQNGQPLIDYAQGIYPDLPTDHISAYMHFKFASADATHSHSSGYGSLNHFRSSEMYLIEAEVAYKLGQESETKRLLTELTKGSGRDPEYNNSSLSGAALFEHLKDLAQIELWGEGHDWFMVKRWGDDIVRIPFADGGNHKEGLRGGPYTKDSQNHQTWMIPNLETDNNKLANGPAQP
ncbi:MAG: RagB/SusD family nutrient uptake outer membrane protein [Candidatus Symbiothrix sp.]|jgi:hypothetical protein|nr:RagB/SusD family nutrient uptake outer membrane protein [Candidatus Symbiothrix sp.]